MITVRHARHRDTTDIARIHIDMWRVAYADLLDPDFLRDLSYSRSRMQWEALIGRHSGVLLVAESGDDGVVGFAAGGAERTRSFPVDGELMALYVLQSHHGRGIGRMLFERMTRELGENGRNGMVVWVLADNPAREFYKHMGGQPAGEQELTIADRSVTEVAYVFRENDRYSIDL